MANAGDQANQPSSVFCFEYEAKMNCSHPRTGEVATAVYNGGKRMVIPGRVDLDAHRLREEAVAESHDFLVEWAKNESSQHWNLQANESAVIHIIEFRVNRADLAIEERAAAAAEEEMANRPAGK